MILLFILYASGLEPASGFHLDTLLLKAIKSAVVAATALFHYNCYIRYFLYISFLLRRNTLPPLQTPFLVFDVVLISLSFDCLFIRDFSLSLYILTRFYGLRPLFRLRLSSRFRSLYSQRSLCHKKPFLCVPGLFPRFRPLLVIYINPLVSPRS